MSKFPDITTAEAENVVVAEYNHSCVVHPERFSVTIHHEPPRSLNPHWRTMPETWFPLCLTCHELVHSISRKDAAYLLIKCRRENFPELEAKYG